MLLVKQSACNYALYAIEHVTQQSCKVPTQRALLQRAAKEYDCAARYGNLALKEELTGNMREAKRMLTKSRCMEMAGRNFAEAVHGCASKRETSQRASRLFTRAGKYTALCPRIVILGFNETISRASLCTLMEVAEIIAAAAQDQCESARPLWDAAVCAAEDLVDWYVTTPGGKPAVYVCPDYATRKKGVDAMVRAAQLTSACALQDERRRRCSSDARTNGNPANDVQSAANNAQQESRGHDESQDAEQCARSTRESVKPVDEGRDGDGDGDGEGTDGNGEVEGAAVGSKRNAEEMDST
jgi:hypothetical protein